MALVLTDELLEQYARQGWKIFTPGYDLSYKRHWDSDWYIVREFYQNALDEHDEAGVSTLPRLDLYSRGVGEPLTLVIEDHGRGIGAESLLLRETKGSQDLRGQFGEGLKFACLTAVRRGYGIHIESPHVEILSGVHHTVMGTKEVALLVFLWRPLGKRSLGTRVEISEYLGELYLDRFIPLIPPTMVSNFCLSPWFEVGRFDRRYTILTPPENRLYVRDIYVRELGRENPSPFSYNLWRVELNPDRDAERYSYQLNEEITRAWCLCDKGPMIELLLAALGQKTYESYLYWAQSIREIEQLKRNRDIWRAAWQRVYGPDAVIWTSQYYHLRAEAYGYKVITTEIIPDTACAFLALIIPTDEQSVRGRGEELEAGIVAISDERLTPEQLGNLKILVHSVARR
jgi:hypothetical protein